MNPHSLKRSNTPLGTWQQPLTESESLAGELDDVAAVFRLFSDETRLRVLALLMLGGEFNVRSLCEHLEQSQPAVSHHLALLRRKGLLRIRRDGKHNFYHLVPGKLDAILGYACQRLLSRPDPPPPSLQH
jgi:ArsR family transcriptional regulator